MSKKPTKDEALEALDFIINVLREHEKDLDRLINELGEITQRFSKTGEVSDKIEKVEERLSTLQTEISNLINYISTTAPPRETAAGAPPLTPPAPPPYPRGPPVIIRCKQWEDFKTLAKDADTVSFLYKETEKTFQVDALKNSRILTYTGPFPTDTHLLKTWLTQELNTPQQKILEGILTTG